MTEPAKARRSQLQRKEAAEKKIIDAALELVSEKGTIAVTMAEIGVRAGYSRGLPYERFGSKEKILEALLQSLIDRFNERRSRRPRVAGGLSSIVSMIETYLDREREEWMPSRALIIMMAEASLSSSSSLKTLVASYNRRHLDYVKKHIVIARENNEINSPASDEALGVLVMGTLRGIVLQSLSDDQIDTPQLKDDIVGSIVAALNPAVSPGRVRDPQRAA